MLMQSPEGDFIEAICVLSPFTTNRAMWGYGLGTRPASCVYAYAYAYAYSEYSSSRLLVVQYG